MIERNSPKKYWNQYFDVSDIPETPEMEPFRTCNITCVAMITGEHPDDVLQYFVDKYGYEIGVNFPHFQWQELLRDYLIDHGFPCREILKKDAYPKPRHVTDDELHKMVTELRKGNVIFYHKKGHYQLMVGFIIDNNGELSFIFDDPAGDRKRRRSDRTRESGCGVIYPMEMVKSEKIYGQCYSVKIDG